MQGMEVTAVEDGAKAKEVFLSIGTGGLHSNIDGYSDAGFKRL